MRGFRPSQDGKRPVCVGGGDEPLELLEQGDVVAFVLERPLVLDETVAVGPGAGFGAPCPPELGLVSVGVLWVGEWEACNFEGHRVTDADGDFEHEPCYSVAEIIEPCNLGTVSGEPPQFRFLQVAPGRGRRAL